MDVAFELFELCCHFAAERDKWRRMVEETLSFEGKDTYRTGALIYDHAYTETARLWARVDGAHRWTDLEALIGQVDRKTRLDVVR